MLEDMQKPLRFVGSSLKAPPDAARGIDEQFNPEIEYLQSV
jgi:hypothetical protein